MAALTDPLTLPCGLTMPNRLAKAALAEALSDSSHLPNDMHDSIYSQWGEGGWGAVLTGNVQIDVNFLGHTKDTTILMPKSNRKAVVARWEELATRAQAHGTPLFMQLNHPGRQSPLGSRARKPLSSSAVPLDLGSGFIAKVARCLVFGTPQEMTIDDIRLVIDQFRDSAVLAEEAGLKGVQVHAAHGYLLTQFLSPRINKRDDEYGGTAVKRARIVKEIVAAIRAATSPSFCIGIKINSADYQEEGGLAESLEQLGEILQESVDYIEISGGTYERPDMTSQDPSEVKDYTGNAPSTARTAHREAFFLEYAMEARKRFPNVALMVTGGFRTREGMSAALQSGACDIVGIGRPAAVDPSLPKKKILNEKISDDEAKLELQRIQLPFILKATGVKPLTAGAISMHFQKELRQRATAKAY